MEYFRTHLRRDKNNELYARVNIVGPADGSTEIPMVIDYQHHEIHSGSAYFISRAFTADDGVTDEVLLVTPAGATHAHMEIKVNATGQTDLMIYEDTTRTGGTSLTPRNRNRNYLDASVITATHTPTGGVVGEMIASIIFGLDTSIGASGEIAGGGAGSRHEIILKENTSYLIATNSATDGNRITLVLDWYEHTDRTM